MTLQTDLLFTHGRSIRELSIAKETKRRPAEFQGEIPQYVYVTREN